MLSPMPFTKRYQNFPTQTILIQLSDLRLLIDQNIINMKGKPSPALSTSKQPSQSSKLTPLYFQGYERSVIFREQQLLGWQIIDMESCLYGEMNITIESITHLTSLYMKIIEKLNTLQDPRENYFSLKMQKLMAEPYVIRCFNNEQDNKKSALDSRRKEMQQKLEKEVERHNHRKVLQQVIVAQEEKQQKLKNRVKEIVQQSNKNLEQRIRRRNQIKQMRNSLLSTSQLAVSDGCISIGSPNFSSNQSRRYRNHRHIHSSSSFQLQQDQAFSFNILKREIEDQQIQQRMQWRLRRQKQDRTRQK